MNDRETSPLKGAKESAKIQDHKPVLTEAQRVELNIKKRAEDSLVAEALSRVDGYSSYSHSKTFSGRAQLRETFKEAMDAGKSAREVLDAVVAKIDQLVDNGSVR